VGKSEGKKSLGRPRRRWEDNAKLNLQKVGWGMDLVVVAQNRDRWRDFVNMVLKLLVQ